jgi:hypothetical protein
MALVVGFVGVGELGRVRAEQVVKAISAGGALDKQVRTCELTPTVADPEG